MDLLLQTQNLQPTLDAAVVQVLTVGAGQLAREQTAKNYLRLFAVGTELHRPRLIALAAACVQYGDQT